MEKKELANILNDILIPVGFKKKGNFWVINGEKITKMVNLQKSQYGNSFYINYGYIINAIPLNGMMMHIYKRLSSLNEQEREKITYLLDLEANMPDLQRKKELEEVIQLNIVKEIQTINTEEDLLTELNQRENLNSVPLVVKNYFNIPID